MCTKSTNFVSNLTVTLIIFMNLTTRLALLGFCLAGLSGTMYAETPDSIEYKIEAQASFSKGQHTPFWLVSNRHGLSSIKKNNGYMRAAAFKHIDRDRRFSWGAGADLALAYNYTSTFIIQQLYGEVKYRCLGAMIGSKEINGEFTNPRLSSGNLLYSGNARPIPQIRAGIPEFTYVPYTKDWLAVKGYISFGMFTDDKWQKDFVAPNGKHTEDVLYHSKGLFLRIGDRSKSPVWAEGGLEMAAQFGGKSYTNGKVIDMPTSLKDIWHVIIPSGGGSDTPIGEQTNVYGNHVGSWNLRLNYDISPEWNVGAYYQHYFEDHSMMFFDYKWKDCLVGIEVSVPKNPVISTFVYEYLYSKDQSAPVYWDHTPEIPEQISGIDNYYNHGIYTGWQHWGMGIGNPLMISPIYNTNGQIYFRDNRIIGHHFGMMGNPTDEIEYRLLFSYTRSWGTYSSPRKEIADNINGLLEVTYSPRRLKGFSGTLSLGADAGDILGRSAGAMITLRKSGWLSL